MANILWIQPNQTLALTTILVDDITPEAHAVELQERGDVPSDWVIAGYDVEWPDDNYPHEAYRWVNDKVVADTNYVAPLAPAPTKEELLLQLQALQAQIESLA
jgi:hypothetical protein